MSQVKIKLSYLVCGTPRSGTNFLCSLLTSTSVVGVPQEYFWKDDVERNSKEWGTTSIGDYYEKVLEVGSTPNGVFAAKVMWGYLEDFLSKLQQLPGKSELDDKELLDSVFPNLKFIYMWRKDYVAQAVSWAKAIQTDIWYSGDTKRPLQELVYEFEVIDNLIKEVTLHNKSWRKWFEVNSVNVFEVQYENFTKEPKHVIGELLEFLGIEYSTDIEIKTEMKKQRDGVNKEWIARYISEKK